MATRFHTARQRRAERSALLAGETFNLVPLVDMLVSILFFSLLTYSGATSFLFSYNLELPPVLRSEAQAAGPDEMELDQLLTIRIDSTGMLVERGSERGRFSREIPGLGEESMVALEELLEEQRPSYPRRFQVLVIPSDGTSYDNVIHVLQRLRSADYPLIALGQRARATRQVASAGTGR